MENFKITQQVSLYYLISCLFFTVSCNLENNPTAPSLSNSTVIMPLKTGNRWIYEGKQLDPSGKVINYFTDTIEVNGEITIEGKLWYIINEVYISRNSKEGLWTAVFMFDKIYDLSLASKYPGLTGDRWDNDICSIVSSDTLIKVPYGEFHCLKYKTYSQLYGCSFLSYEFPFLCEVSELKDMFLN